jgi:diadenosine tetraphosphatase ApaH/serine/threonine PP2A family protein phosphatase
MISPPRVPCGPAGRRLYAIGDIHGRLDLLDALLGRIEEECAATPPPDSHRDFLAALPLWYAAGEYLFVHAGLRPGLAIEHQDPEDLLWIREPFLSWRPSFGPIVVHGHTPVATPEIHPNRIAIDTRAWRSGHLTALAIEGERRWFLAT